MQVYLEKSDIMEDMEEGCDASSLPVRLLDFHESEVPFSRLKASYVGGFLPMLMPLDVWAQFRAIGSKFAITIRLRELVPAKMSSGYVHG